MNQDQANELAKEQAQAAIKLTKKQDGGLVYPGKRHERIEHSDEAKAQAQATHSWGDVNYPGLTRRDWLAGLAMQAVISDHEAMKKLYEKYGGAEETAKYVAKFSYHQADAIIAESNK